MTTRQILKSLNYNDGSIVSKWSENGKKHIYLFPIDPWLLKGKDLNRKEVYLNCKQAKTGRLIKDVPFGATVHIYMDKSTTVVIPYWKFIISEILR